MPADPLSLPLMRKTFIEADRVWPTLDAVEGSLPLMRKTFIEAPYRCALGSTPQGVSSAYAEDFH